MALHIYMCYMYNVNVVHVGDGGMKTYIQE